MSIISKISYLPELVVLEHTLVPVVGIIAGVLLAAELPPIFEILLPLFIFILVSIGFNSFNAVFDKYLDMVNKPLRPIPRETYKPSHVLLFSLVLFLLAAVLSVKMPTIFMGIVFLDILTAILYSVPQIYLKRFALVGTATAAVHYGLFPILAGYSLYAELGTIPYIIPILTVITAFSVATLKDFENYPGDRRFGIKTLPVLFGRGLAAIISAILILLPYILVTVLVYINYLPVKMLYSLVCIIPAFVAAVSIVKDQSRAGTRMVFEQSVVVGVLFIFLLALMY